MSVERIQLGVDGPTLSRIVYGAWRLLDNDDGHRPEHVLGLIEACLEAGITTVDHADVYGEFACEEAYGQALRLKPGLKTQLEFVTKTDICPVTPARPEYRVKHYNTSQDYIVQSAERSLSMLGIDAIDVLLIHRPDPLMDGDEVASAFTRLRDAGKVKHFGVSNFTSSQFDLLQSRLDFKLVTNQVQISPLHLSALSDGTLDHCQQNRVRPMAWSPFGGGRLFKPQSKSEHRVHRALKQIGESHQATIDQVALAWLMRLPAGVLPVIGTGQADRILSAAKACAINFDRQHWFEILQASTGHEVP